MKNFNVLTVSQLNFYIKSILEDDKNLKNVFLKGEISNLKCHFSSGHIYFSVKDEKSLVKCVMFAGYAKYLKFAPEDGMKVILRGRVSLYESSGQYQLYVEDMYPDGVGELHFAFEQLKRKLFEEGLFDEARKKSIPNFPKSIGVITSKSGAVIQDIKNVISRRCPMCEIVLCPVSVQGDDAVPQIINAIKLFNYRCAADVLIIARGGGSLEDLWAFNNEDLAREVSKSDIPVISAVGHETDFTICDFVADLRAPTPSAAAELAVPNIEDIRNYLDVLSSSVNNLIQNKIADYNVKLDDFCYKMKLFSPLQKIAESKFQVQTLNSRLLNSVFNKLEKNNAEVNVLTSKLETLSPLSVLNRGYSIAYKDKKILKSVKSVNTDDLINIQLSDGEIECKVIKKENE